MARINATSSSVNVARRGSMASDVIAFPAIVFQCDAYRHVAEAAVNNDEASNSSESASTNPNRNPNPNQDSSTFELPSNRRQACT